MTKRINALQCFHSLPQMYMHICGSEWKNDETNQRRETTFHSSLILFDIHDTKIRVPMSECNHVIVERPVRIVDKLCHFINSNVLFISILTALLAIHFNKYKRY